MTAVLVDQGAWGHIRLGGADRIRFLNGMCTVDVPRIPEGGWRRAVMCNVKGRITAVLDVVHRGDHLLLICEPALRDPTIDTLLRHAVMDEVDIAATRVDVHRVWGDAAAVWTAPPVFAPLPAAAADPAAIEIRRVEAGLPRWGVDLGDESFPFESLLDRCVDYDKGCYLGQEPVYRVHSQGNPARQMRGLRVDGDGPVPVGAQVVHPARAEAGPVTSAVVSPALGSIALATLHRTACAPGAEVQVAGRRAVVVELPFAAAAAS